MADKSADTPSSVVLDDEGKRLQLQAEKAKYRQAIAAATQSASESLLELGKISDSPAGEVTLGEKAGAFGPWLAHRTLQSAATKIGGAVAGVAPRLQGRLLVVSDRSLLGGAATARLVRDRLARLTVQLDELPAVLDAAAADLPDGALQHHRRFGPAAEARGEGGGEEPDEEASEKKEDAPSPGSTLGAALDLLSLVRTDYTLTAASVTASPSELATLTAAALAGLADLAVEVDGFTAAGGSPSLTAVDRLAKARDTGRSALATLEARLAPVEAELVALRARISRLEDSWERWAVTKEVKPAGGAALRERIETLSDRVDERTAVASPARSLADHAGGLLTEAGTALTALMQPAGDAESPLVTAVRWERLRAGAGGAAQRIDHVLYVGIDQLAADTVTRRSLLGTSGRLTFLGAATVSWLLLDTGTGAVRIGGSFAAGTRLRFDLESGGSDLADLGSGGPLDEDPLRKAEKTAAAGVLVIAVLLAVITVVAVLRLVLA